MAKIYEDKQRGSSLRDTFGLVAKQSPAPHQSNMSNVNVVITDVAWSKPQRYKSSGDEANTPEIVMDDDETDPVGTPSNKKKEEVLDSIVAAAGSNGVVVVWSARRSFLAEGDGSASSMANQQPEAILSQHTRAINRLAWHPRRPGLLLSASQVSICVLASHEILIKGSLRNFKRRDKSDTVLSSIFAFSTNLFLLSP